MKEVFMPSMDELYKMQDMGADLKLYLYAKAISILFYEVISSLLGCIFLNVAGSSFTD